jgi:LysR family transcriptional repressor of citA
LGSTLFDRQNNRVTLSEAGRYFLPEAQKLVNSTESTIHKMHAFKQGYRRTWTIAISPLMAETILPYFLRSFMKLQPDLEITIRVEESYLIEGLVDSGVVNIGISALDAQTKGIESITIYEEPILFVMPVDIYDEESGPPIDIKGVLQNNYLFTHHHPVFWDDLLVKLHKKISGIRTMKVTQAHIAKRFVQDDLGVSFLPHSIVRRELLEGKIMQPHFDLFDLPTVSTFIILKKKGDLEKLFIEQISKFYFG